MLTHNYVFDHREDDVYACVADIGWITGHSYVVYEPLANEQEYLEPYHLWKRDLNEYIN